MSDSIRKDFPTFAEGFPFKATLPAGSNGFCHVVDKNGDQVAGCFVGGSTKATAIARALNEVFAPIETATATEQGAGR